MYQLVTEHVNVVSTRKGLSDVAIMTPESVDDLPIRHYAGARARFFVSKGRYVGQHSRRTGHGPKKASALIAQYGSLDEVIAHADEVKGKMGENLRAHIDDALLSRKVATIRTDAPVELDFDETSFPAFSADEVSAALGTLGITAMQNRWRWSAARAGLLLPPVWLRYLLWFAQPPAMPTRLVPLRLRSPARLMPASGSPPWWTTTRKRRALWT